ncbi:MAG: hypothetical protein KDK07_06795 [Bauldia sp.]|nr:hypothetical protein [Bauldia sp.]
MHRTLAALIFTSALVPASMAAADCTCRARDGVSLRLGETVCLNTANGPRLARCEMVLNNSSWKVTEEDCPTARATRVPATFSALPPGFVRTLTAARDQGRLWPDRGSSVAEHF